MKFTKLLCTVFALIFLASVVVFAAVPEHANPLKAGVNERSFMVDNYGTEIAQRIDALRPRLIGDAKSIAEIDSYTGNYDNTPYVWPALNGGTDEVIRRLGKIAQELGLRFRYVTPNSANPPIPNTIGSTNWANGNRDGIAYGIVEIGPEDAMESVVVISHMDTVHDSLRIDYESALGITDPNTTAGKHWILGGILSGKEIIDPVTGRTAIVGRGLDDDKGPAIPGMYALKAIKDSGVPLKRKIILLFGPDEEGGGGFRCVESFTRLETFPKLCFCPDASEATLRIADSNTSPIWYARGVISWDNPSDDDITLRFPAILPREEYALSNTNNNTGNSVYVRWKSSYDAYHIGSLVGEGVPTSRGNGYGLQLKTAAWLVCKDPVTANLLHNSALSIKNSYIDKYWTYLQLYNYYKPFIVRPTNLDVGPAGSVNPRLNPDGTPEHGRWDLGIDIELTTSPGSTFQDTVQIVARGVNQRFGAQNGNNSRQILVDFLANLTIPSGKTARWHDAVKRINSVFPYGEAAPGKETYRAAHLFDAPGIIAQFNEFTPSLTTNAAAKGRTMSIPAASWDIDVQSNVAEPTRPAARSVTYVGNNDDVDMLYFELRFLYTLAPYDEDWFKPSSEAKNTDYLPTVQARKTREALAAAGIGSTTLATVGSNPQIGTSTVVNTGGLASYNQTSGGSGIGNTGAFPIPTYYTSYTHDSVQYGLRSTNAYFRENDIPYRESLTFQTGGNFSRSFRNFSRVSGDVNGINAPPEAGISVSLGGWGGKSGYHGYNERIEPDGFIGYANKIAMMTGDVAQGRYHTYDVRGNGNNHERMVLRLENVASTPDFATLTSAAWLAILKEDVYISEFNELPGIMASLEARGILPVDPGTNVDFLFGRKFLMKGMPAGGALELTVKTNAPEKGYKQHLVVAGELADGSDWEVINNNEKDSLQTVAKVAVGSKFDKAVASADVVNARLVAFLVTEREDSLKDKIKDKIEDILDAGCNAGFSLLALLAIAGFVLRRKR